jgi:hypothetical protein
MPPVLVRAGTVIPITSTSRVSTKNSKDGDGIYGKTSFPITVDNKIVIPEGSNVRGKITEVKRPGRVKGKGELTLNFQTIVLPSGITCRSTRHCAARAARASEGGTARSDSSKAMTPKPSAQTPQQAD